MPDADNLRQGSEAARAIDGALLGALMALPTINAYSVLAAVRATLFRPEIRRHVQNYAAELDAEARGKTYVILDSPEASGGHAILCLRCRLTSHHPGDVEHLWCARCNAEHER